MSDLTRIDRLRKRMADQDLAALLITDETNVTYLSGFTGDSSFLLVTADQAMILSDRRYETQIATECSAWKAVVRGPERTMLQVVQQAVHSLREEGPKPRIGLEADHIPWAMYSGFAEKVENAAWCATSGMVEGLRLYKEPGEIEILRRAVQIAERAFEALRFRLRPEWTELQMAHELEATMRDLGATGCGFAPIVAIGANAALPHAHPGLQKIADAPELLIDWGAKFQGYTSDLTRTLHMGPVTKKFGEVYQVVLDAQLAAIDKIRPGIELKVVDAAARNVIEKSGYGDAFGHSLGHGIGRQVHEMPRMASISEGILEAGMVVTVEPGIYLPGQFGVRIEDDVVVTPTGCEVLSRLSKGLDDCSVIL